MTPHRTGVLTTLFAGMLAVSGATSAFEFDFKGSLGEQGHTRYVPPLSNPLLNETPFITTEMRPIFLRNNIPSNFLTRGGNIDLYALELRLAITKRLGLIASKDGYARIDFDDVLDDENGFANASIGFKYALVSEPETESVVSAGIEYEMPIGDLETSGIDLSGNGQGFLDFFVTGTTTIGKTSVQGSAGINRALDSDANSSMLHASAHIDYELFPGFFPLIEANHFHFYRKGDNLPVDFEGIDLVNFGATDPGKLFTMAVGARYRFNRNFQIGAGYEEPISTREDIMDWRFYLDAVISY